MSAITGICDLRAISGSASASSCDGTATRTIWQPAAVSSAICCRVALTSAVSVVVIDCTDTGAPPPTGTAWLPLPTRIWREMRRVATGSGGSWGIPRSTVIWTIASLCQVNRVEDVRRDEDETEPDEEGEHAHAHRDQLLHVYQARIRAPAEPGQPGPDPLVDHDGEMTAVQREQRQQVEGTDEDIERDNDEQQLRDGELPPAAGRYHLPGVIGGPDDAADIPGRGLGAVLGEQVWQRRRQLLRGLPG